MRYLRRSVLCVETGERRSPAELAGAAGQFIILSRFYYLFVAYLVGTSYLGFDRAYQGKPPTAPVWPIKIVEPLTGIDWLAYETAVTIIGLAFAIAAALAPGVLVWRLGTFLYVLLQVALQNSYGSINHGTHGLLYISFALVFLPRDTYGRRNRIARENVLACLAVLWLVQTALLLPYALSGFWKIWKGGLELFSPDALTRILLQRLLQEVDDIPPLLPFVSEHTLLAQVMWLCAVYIEFFALLVVFRPHLHRPFGVLLMLFHVTSDWLMNIAFSSQVLMVGVFLVLSPVAPRTSLSGIARSLPIAGIPLRAMKRLKSSPQGQEIDRLWLVYDGECPLCSNYAQFLKLRQAVRELVLVDARQGGPIVEEVRSLPHDLDEGMVVRIGERYYVGHEALNVLALLSESRGVFNRLNRMAFNSPVAARLGYPWLKLGRRVLLKLKGVGPMGRES